MVNPGAFNNDIVLKLSLNSSMVEVHNSTNTTKKPCSSLNFDPSLSLALSSDHDRDHDHNITKKKHAYDHGGLYGQDSASGGGGGGGSSLVSVASVCAKREREVKSEVISTTSEVEQQQEKEDDDDNGVNGRKKLRLTKAQSALLEEAFKHHSSLNPKHKQELARELKLRPRQVEVWFQNRRARTKLKQTEVDYEYLKKCCEALKEENTRLHKELQELKVLSKQPPYMQLPAATLTMCPSCKCTGATTSALLSWPQTHTSLIHLQPVEY